MKKTSLSIFCRVIDNYGDIGICWRLAQAFHQQYRLDVHLWLDDLASFKKMEGAVELDKDSQMIEGVHIHYWHFLQNEALTFSPEQITDVVIEFFACELPSQYVRAMALQHPSPIWINYEGLSAEEWVEGCHLLPSPHPQYSLTKYFFFPGFTPKTGGILFEKDYFSRKQLFEASLDNQNTYLKKLGLHDADLHQFKISLFCYPDAPLELLCQAWAQSSTPIICLVPDGVAPEKIASLQTQYKHTALKIIRIPFQNQEAYDELLWSCDLNFVRGEDSFVRAQLANKPFIWHIYPQDEDLHLKKLNAFLNRYTPTAPSLNQEDHALSYYRQFFLAWNHSPQTSPINGFELWNGFCKELSQIHTKHEYWLESLVKQGSCLEQLRQVIAENTPS